MIGKIILIIILSLALFLLILLSIIGIIVYKEFKKVFYRSECKSLLDVDLTNTHYEKHLDKIRTNILELRARPKEDIYIDNDNLKLHGSFYNNDSTNTVIMVHGYHAKPENNFHASSKSFFNHGYNVLLIDDRSHNESEGSYTTMGLREQYDVLKWINWVNENTNTKNIVLYGVSMGAATVGYLANKLDNTNVRTIVMDCGFTSFYDEIFYNERNHKISFLVLFFMRLFAKMKFGIDIKNRTLDSLKESNVPVYFIHGLNDELVPVEHTISAYNVTLTEKRYHYVEGAGHTTSFLIDYDYLDQDLFLFINKYLR